MGIFIFLIFNLAILIFLFQALRLTLKKKLIIWLICLPITLTTFFILNITAEPLGMRGSSDNLILALLFYLLHPVILSFYYLTGDITNRYVIQKRVKIKHRICILVGSLVFCILFIILQLNDASVIIKERGIGLDALTNNIYFNNYMFFFLFTFSVFCGILFTFKKERW